MREHSDSAADRGGGTSSTAAAAGGPDAERVDDLFSVLASARRRHVLDYLRASGPADVDELAAELASRDDDGGSAAPEDRRRAYVALYHNDVPKMVDAGFVTFDGATGEVALVDDAGPVRTYLGLATPDPADD